MKGGECGQGSPCHSDPRNLQGFQASRRSALKSAVIGTVQSPDQILDVYKLLSVDTYTLLEGVFEFVNQLQLPPDSFSDYTLLVKIVPEQHNGGRKRGGQRGGTKITGVALQVVAVPNNQVKPTQTSFQDAMAFFKRAQDELAKAQEELVSAQQQFAAAQEQLAIATATLEIGEDVQEGMYPNVINTTVEMMRSLQKEETLYSSEFKELVHKAVADFDAGLFSLEEQTESTPSFHNSVISQIVKGAIENFSNLVRDYQHDPPKATTATPVFSRTNQAVVCKYLDYMQNIFNIAMINKESLKTLKYQVTMGRYQLFLTQCENRAHAIKTKLQVINILKSDTTINIDVINDLPWHNISGIGVNEDAKKAALEHLTEIVTLLVYIITSLTGNIQEYKETYKPTLIALLKEDMLLSEGYIETFNDVMMKLAMGDDWLIDKTVYDKGTTTQPDIKTNYASPQVLLSKYAMFKHIIRLIYTNLLKEYSQSDVYKAEGAERKKDIRWPSHVHTIEFDHPEVTIGQGNKGVKRVFVNMYKHWFRKEVWCKIGYQVCESNDINHEVKFVFKDVMLPSASDEAPFETFERTVMGDTDAKARLNLATLLFYSQSMTYFILDEYHSYQINNEVNVDWHSYNTFIFDRDVKFKQAFTPVLSRVATIKQPLYQNLCKKTGGRTTKEKARRRMLVTKANNG